jgi:hypothetical protein
MIWTDKGLRDELKEKENIILELQETINDRELDIIEANRSWTEKYGELEKTYMKMEESNKQMSQEIANLDIENRDLQVIKKHLQNLIKNL